MSRTFVKDPREVVKPGDIVRVKVLDVDKPRKRISLTLRLDDEIGSQQPTGSAGLDRSQRRAMSSAAPAKKPAAAEGALADALRRAGLGQGTARK
jgi:uncharacterized protein